MGKIKKVALVAATTAAGLILTVTEAFGSAYVCTGGTCLFVNGTGLKVNYATVVNNSKHSGRGMISSTCGHQTHVGPTLPPGRQWRYDYNRNMPNGCKVCGSIEGIDVACANVHS